MPHIVCSIIQRRCTSLIHRCRFRRMQPNIRRAATDQTENRTRQNIWTRPKSHLWCKQGNGERFVCECVVRLFTINASCLFLRIHLRWNDCSLIEVPIHISSDNPTRHQPHTNSYTHTHTQVTRMYKPISYQQPYQHVIWWRESSIKMCTQREDKLLNAWSWCCCMPSLTVRWWLVLFEILLASTSSYIWWCVCVCVCVGTGWNTLPIILHQHQQQIHLVMRWEMLRKHYTTKLRYVLADYEFSRLLGVPKIKNC